MPGCTSGYKLNSERVHFFSVPTDDVLREKWQRALRRNKAIVACKQFVCEKHFQKHDIEKKKLLFDSNGKIVGISPYKRIKLKCGVVPSQFPWTKVTQVNKINKICIILF